MAKKTSAFISGVLEEMTIDDVRAFKPRVVVLPLGSTEPHGPHLPYGTDTFEVSDVARRGVIAANKRGARALLYPTLPITNNANFRKFPFACRIGVRTLMSLLVDIVTQCKEDGVMKVVLVNGHGGNTGAIPAAMRELAGMEGMPFVCCAEGLTGPDFKDPIVHGSDHAGEAETSRVMHLRPELVKTGKFANNPFGTVKIPALRHANFIRPWHLYIPASAGGETRKSSATKGKLVQDEMAKNLAQLLVELAEAKLDERFPYK
jgi:creatinine amidohydrolase